MQVFASRRSIPAFSASHALTVIGTLRNIPPLVSKRYTDIAGRMVPGLMAHSFRSDVGQCLTVQALSNGSRSCDDSLQTCLSCATSGTSFAGSACSLPGYMHDVRFVGVSQHRLFSNRILWTFTQSSVWPRLLRKCRPAFVAKDVQQPNFPTLRNHNESGIARALMIYGHSGSLHPNRFKHACWEKIPADIWRT